MIAAVHESESGPSVWTGRALQADDDAALQEKAAYLMDHCGPLADKARPHPVQRLQIELLIGLIEGQFKARCGRG